MAINAEQSERELSPLPNRAARRGAHFTPAHQRILEFNQIWNQTADELSQSTKLLNQTVKVQRHNLADIIFRSQPFIGLYLGTRRELPPLIEQAEQINARGVEPKIPQMCIDVFRAQDFFSYKRNGTNLLDIEQMPLPLSQENIGRIRDMIRVGWLRDARLDRFIPWLKSSEEQRLIRQSVVILAAQSFARPDRKDIVPSNLKPLHQRLVDYFDYWTSWIIDPEQVDPTFTSYLRFCRDSHWLFDAISSYLPARFGLTPASAIKAFHLWALNLEMPRVLSGAITKRITQAYRPNSWPSDLEQYRHYNPKMDQRARKIWQTYLLDHRPDSGETAKQLDDTEHLMDRFRRYRNLIFKDVQSDPKHSLTVTMPDGHPISHLTVTNENKTSLVFITHFREQGAYLTLEVVPDIIDKEQFRLFGLPPELPHDNPYAVKLVLNEILHPLVELAKRAHPQVEPIPVIWTSFQLPAATTIEPKEPRVEVRDVKPVKKQRSVPRVLTPIARFFAEEPVPKLNRQERQWSVIYSRSQMRRLLGEKQPDSVVNRVMREIKDFEFGRSGINRKLEDAGNLWELRTGQFRVILKHEKGRVWSVVEAGDRKDIFKKERVTSANASRFA